MRGITNLGNKKPEETRTIAPDFSSGNQVVQPTSADKVMTQVTLTKAANHLAANIKSGETLYGVAGNAITFEPGYIYFYGFTDVTGATPTLTIASEDKPVADTHQNNTGSWQKISISEHGGWADIQLYCQAASGDVGKLVLTAISPGGGVSGNLQAKSFTLGTNEFRVSIAPDQYDFVIATCVVIDY